MKIGIDIGGSHIAVGLIEKNANVIIKKEKDISLIDKKNIEEFLIKNIVKYIKEILEEKNISIEKIELIGISAPGTIKNGKIIKATNLKLENFNIVSKLKKYFNVKISIRNDGKSATLAEKQYGEMKEYKDFVYICLGTGIGGGVIINNKLLKPAKFEGFEIGHITIERNGKKCTCGKKGCWEQYASMRVLKTSLIKELKLDKKITSFELLNILKEKMADENISKIIDKYLENLAIGIENIINIFEPEAICIGGSFVFYKDILLGKLIEKLKKRNVTYNKVIPQIVCAKFKNDAGMVGAIL